ncbi:putative reverse transcriptase domain-containing protein [Tanacetum coccineum]
MVTTCRNSDDDVPNFEAMNMLTALYVLMIVPIYMFDFDVIFGMDWLASHRATIDCYAKTVIFGNVRQPEFVYHGSLPLKSVKLISAMKARTLISHGCQGFLASVMDTSLESPNIENLSVVREFADVFPDELPWQQYQ